MTRLVVILCFLVAFAAGLMVGLAARTPGLASPARPGATTRPRGWQGFLISDLGLTPQQQQQLQQIWSAPPGPRDFGEQREQRRKERDQGILALVPPDQRSKYQQVQQDYDQQIDAIKRQERASFDAKVEQTKEILQPEQRAKYEEFLKRHDRGPRGRGGPEKSDPNRRDDGRATSSPAATGAAESR